MDYLWSAISSPGNNFDLLLLLAASAMKATLLLSIVALLCRALRRLSAATRHLLWTLSLSAALLLPGLSFIGIWEVPVVPAHISSWSPAPAHQLGGTTDDAFLLPEKGMRRGREVSFQKSETKPGGSVFQPALDSTEKQSPRTDSSALDVLPQQSGATLQSNLMAWAFAIWLAGVLLVFFRLVVGLMSTNLLTRGAVEFKDPELTGLFSTLLDELHLRGKVQLLRSERTLMPIVCGILRPVVLLPASADDWSEERRRMVLLHELTHVTRKDCLTQMLGQMACAFYWFNPLVWHAARRLRVEREQACDDYVLSIGTKPSDYAHHLLEIARYLQEHSVFQWSHTTTVAMARRSQLEGRLLAILSAEGKRRAMSQMMTTVLIAAMFVLFISLAVIRPTISHAGNPVTAGKALKDELYATNRADRFLTTVFGLKDEAIIQGLQQQVEAQGNHAVNDDDSLEKIPNDPQLNQEGKQVGEIPAEPAIEVEPEMPPQAESIPGPPIVLEHGLPAVPFIKAQYPQERKSNAADKSEDYIDEMASVGYTNLSIKELVSLKSSGVTADYVRSLNALGLSQLTTKELVGMRNNDVTPAFIQSIRNAGYKDLTLKELITFGVHGITPEFINRLRNAGYSNLTAKQLTDFGIHGVTPEFINSMRALGFGNLSAKELVTLRIHDITPEFVRAARKRLGDLTIKQIISLKIEGLIEGSGDEED
jgi:beta-lactamase regulating signal transducer with metallopeptidase domain